MFAVIFIPNFSLQSALRHEPELRARAIALIDPAVPKPAIVQLTPAARACGVCEGLTASQAIARCADLVIRSRSISQESTATETLLQTAYAFSPNIEATAPGVCTMELKGLGLEFNSAAESWAGKILELLDRFHLNARVGFAETPALGLIAARSADPVLTVRTEPFLAEATRGGFNKAIAAFPVTALDPPSEMLEILQTWGIVTVGQFLALGKDAVVERLGSAAAELFQRASPLFVRPLKLSAPPETFEERVEFENEIETMEPLLFVLRRFVEQLARRLESIYLAVAEFHLRLGLSSGASYERCLKIPAPTGNITTLFRMLQTHLETVRTDSPIVSLQLEATPGKVGTHQFGLFESTLRNPNQFAETMARLVALLGAENVGSPQLISTHKPDSFRMIVPNFDAASARDHRPSTDQAANKGAPLQGLPFHRFRPPLPAHFEFRNKKPALVRSELFTGGIAEVRGPFLSSGNWWDRDSWSREEWDVETGNGLLLRIFRSSGGDFVDGVYD